MNAVGHIETAIESGNLYRVLAYLWSVPAARIERALKTIAGPGIK